MKKVLILSLVLNVLLLAIVFLNRIPIPKTSGFDISQNTKAESPSSESRLPFLFNGKKGRFAFFVESDAKHISAFDLESGRLMWSKDLSKEWEEYWKRPIHGLKACSILSLKFGTEKYWEYIVVELNDGQMGLINMESGTTRGPISD